MGNHLKKKYYFIFTLHTFSNRKSNEISVRIDREFVRILYGRIEGTGAFMLHLQSEMFALRKRTELAVDIWICGI